MLYYKPTSKAFVTPTTATAFATLNFLFDLLRMSALLGGSAFVDWLARLNKSPVLGLRSASPWLCLRSTAD